VGGFGQAELGQEVSLRPWELISTSTHSGVKQYVSPLSQRVKLGVVLWQPRHLIRSESSPKYEASVVHSLDLYTGR